MDFEQRIEAVIPMLEAKGLFGVVSLVKDLKKEIDKAQLIRNKTLDEFADKAWEILGSSDRDIYCNETIKEIIEEMKRGE